MKSSDFMKNNEVKMSLEEKRRLRVGVNIEKTFKVSPFSNIKLLDDEPKNRSHKSTPKYTFHCDRTFKSETHVKLIGAGELMLKSDWKKLCAKRHTENCVLAKKCVSCRQPLSEEMVIKSYKTCEDCRKYVYEKKALRGTRYSQTYNLKHAKEIQEYALAEGILPAIWIKNKIEEFLNGCEP